jgi:ectoine hydroxylase-related dioxygenase (phytanoyl-CoA dioxygenase family)
MLDTALSALPEATCDLAQAENDLKAHGLAIVDGALDDATLRTVRDALYRVAEQDLSRGRIEEAVRTDEGVQRVWNLPSRDPVFCDLVEHPAALRLVRSGLGWPVLLSNISGNITAPGSGEMMLHADQGAFPGIWDRAFVVNIVWCLDDFTEANGGTRLALGSHLQNRSPGPQEADTPTVALAAKAGSMVAVDGRVWHKTGANVTADQRRAGVFAVYSLPMFLPQENWWLSLDPSVRQFGSETLLTLLGFKGDYFYGRVNGRPVGDRPTP